MTSTIILGADNRAALRRLAETLALPSLQPGWVWLAGAGPGDPGLASLHTLHAIGEADVILTDALVNKALLALARHRLGTTLTVLGMAIGIAATLCPVALGEGSASALHEDLITLGDNLVWVQAAVKGSGGVRALSPRR